MEISNDTGPETVNFKENNGDNNSGLHKKGGKREKSWVLENFIEQNISKDKFFDNEKRLKVFFPKRMIGGKEVEGRKIKGWSEVPTVLGWESTYRGSEFINNFKKVSKKLRNGGLSELIHTESDLSKADKNFNHAVCVFLNSYFQKKKTESFNEPSEMLEMLKVEEECVNHAEETYLNDKYERQAQKRTQVVNNKRIEYSQYKLTTYEQVVEFWLEYIERMEKTTIPIAEMQSGEFKIIDPAHRWKNQYTQKMLAKFKDLERSEYSDMWTTMISLTTYQDKVEGEPDKPKDFEHENRGPSWFESMERLKDSLDKLLKVLREVSRRELETDLHYLWVVEAHKTGFPHIHLVIFGDVSEWLNEHANEIRIKDILEEEHDLGRSGIATSFDTKPPSGDGAISDISNYLMKYLAKNFGEIKSKYESQTLEEKEWGTMVYNACMWLSGYRTWGTSRSIGSVMKTNRNESEKEYKNLGGNMTDVNYDSFEDLIMSEGDVETMKRVMKRNQFRQAVERRK